MISGAARVVLLQRRNAGHDMQYGIYVPISLHVMKRSWGRESMKNEHVLPKTNYQNY